MITSVDSSTISDATLPALFSNRPPFCLNCEEDELLEGVIVLLSSRHPQYLLSCRHQPSPSGCQPHGALLLLLIGGNFMLLLFQTPRF
jgi:hypothetical protein